MSHVIYALQDPITEQIRYIGKSKNPRHRLQNHLTPGNLKKRKHSSRWLCGLKKKGLVPNVIELEKIETGWEEAEKFWIEYFKFLGCDLTNITSGGEGGITLGFKGKKWSNEQRQNYKNSRLGVSIKAPPEAVKARSEANKKAWEEKRKLGTKKKGPVHNESFKLRQSKTKGQFTDEQLIQIFELKIAGMKQIDIARQCKTSPQVISHILKGKSYGSRG